MLKRLNLVLVCVLFISIHNANASTPGDLYKSLASAIATARGTLLLNFRAGLWRSSIDGHTVQWNIDDNTRAQITFDYQSGALNSASIVFQPAIHIYVKNGNKGFSAAVRSITYDNFGDVANYDVKYDTPTANDPNALNYFRKTLRLSTTPQDAFTGKPFPKLGDTHSCSAQFSNCAQAASAMLYEVRFEPTADMPALFIGFKDQSTIYFSRSSGPTHLDNFVTVRTGSSVTFSEIDYDVDERSIAGTLEKMDVQIERGLLSGRDYQLNLDPASRLTFARVRFEHTISGFSQVDGTDGLVNAGVGSGSRINFATAGTNTSNFMFDNGSSVVLQGFSLTLDDSHGARFEIGGGSQVNVNVRDGRIGLGDRGFLSLLSGQIAAQIAGAWDSGSPPVVDIHITALDVALGASQFNPTSESSLKVTGGNIKSSDFELKTFENPYFLGTIDQASFNLDQDSRFQLGNGIVAVTASGGMLQIATQASPLAIRPQKPYVVGAYSLDLPFKSLRTSEHGDFQLANGKAHFNIANNPDGTIGGDHNTISGLASLESSHVPMSWNVELYDGSFSKAPNDDIRFDSTLKLTLNALQLNVTTPFIKGYTDSDGKHHDNFRAFPISLSASLQQPVSAIGRFSAYRSKYTIADNTPAAGPLMVNVNFNLNIPGGSGEHEDADNPNSADGTHGPDDYKHFQEAIQDTYPLCTVHLYLRPANYAATGTVAISTTPNGLDVHFGNITTSSDVAFTRDGCDPSLFTTIVGAIVGGLIGGPAGATVGAAAGHIAGNKLDDAIDTRIEAGIIGKLHSLNFGWHFGV